MKVLIDTNILISASLFPNSVPYLAYQKAVTFPYRGVICEQNLDELRRVYNRKFPDMLSSLDRFLATALTVLEIIPIPLMDSPEESQIRDVKDRPILRAAIHNKIDVLLTGDKDFLEAGIREPRIVTASEFLA